MEEHHHLEVLKEACHALGGIFVFPDTPKL